MKLPVRSTLYHTRAVQAANRAVVVGTQLHVGEYRGAEHVCGSRRYQHTGKHSGEKRNRENRTELHTKTGEESSPSIRSNGWVGSRKRSVHFYHCAHR
jgi:hypothetical protein